MADKETAVAEFAAARAKLASIFLSDENAANYLKAHSAAADTAVKSLVNAAGLSDRIAVVAVGGYGREQLFPHSDLDLLFLLPDDVLDSELSEIETILGDLWSLGLTVGHSVRTIDECLKQGDEDITAQTAMLESRYLQGDRELYERYQKTIFEHLNPRDFFRAKYVEQQQRHLKYNDSPYALEPNIKESPGGFRDLNVLIWLMKASHHGSTWSEVAKTGLITKREADLLNTAMRHIYRLRIHMHLYCNRHEDRLLFEIQEAVAHALKVPEIDGRRASELLMQRYYLNAKSISQLNTIILQALKEKFVPEASKPGKSAGSYFVVRGDVLDLAADDVFEKHPEAILEAFLFREKNPNVTRKSTRLCRALLASHALINDEFRKNPVNKATFLKIIKAKTGVYHTLSEMNRWGILGRFLPDFKHIVGQMQHDLFHAYTVDQHTILSIRYLRHFTRSENAHEMPLCTELMMSLKNNWRLVLALLFHDIGKGHGGDHSTIGAEEFRRFAEEFDLAPADADYIEFLVREHLTMSKVAQKQDITDPAVVQAFTKKIGTRDKLIGLYLITVCDIRATSPTVWNSWKAQLLTGLFMESTKTLRGRGLSRSMLVERRRKDALPLCRFNESGERLINSFWDTLDIAYFMRHSVSDIVWHAQTLLPVLADKHTITAFRALHGMKSSFEVMILTRDRSELFVTIASLFQRYQLSILEAQIHTTKDGWVLDSFIVVDGGKNPDIEETLNDITRELPELIDSGKPAPAPYQGRLSRRSRSFPITPSISIRPDANGRQYLLSLVATDRLGLLASVARLLSEFHINLVTARIATLGERVEDVFLVEGATLKDPAQTGELERRILKTIET